MIIIYNYCICVIFVIFAIRQITSDHQSSSIKYESIKITNETLHEFSTKYDRKQGYIQLDIPEAFPAQLIAVHELFTDDAFVRVSYYGIDFDSDDNRRLLQIIATRSNETISTQTMETKTFFFSFQFISNETNDDEIDLKFTIRDFSLYRESRYFDNLKELTEVTEVTEDFFIDNNRDMAILVVDNYEILSKTKLNFETFLDNGSLDVNPDDDDDDDDRNDAAILTITLQNQVKAYDLSIEIFGRNQSLHENLVKKSYEHVFFSREILLQFHISNISSYDRLLVIVQKNVSENEHEFTTEKVSKIDYITESDLKITFLCLEHENIDEKFFIVDLSKIDMETTYISPIIDFGDNNYIRFITTSMKFLEFRTEISANVELLDENFCLRNDVTNETCCQHKNIDNCDFSLKNNYTTLEFYAKIRKPMTYTITRNPNTGTIINRTHSLIDVMARKFIDEHDSDPSRANLVFIYQATIDYRGKIEMPSIQMMEQPNVTMNFEIALMKRDRRISLVFTPIIDYIETLIGELQTFVFIDDFSEILNSASNNRLLMILHNNQSTFLNIDWPPEKHNINRMTLIGKIEIFNKIN